MQRVRVYSFEASLKFRIQIPPTSNGHRQTASLHQTPDFCQHTILIRTLVARLYLLFFGPLFSWESYLVCVFLFFNSIKERRKKTRKKTPYSRRNGEFGTIISFLVHSSGKFFSLQHDVSRRRNLDNSWVAPFVWVLKKRRRMKLDIVCYYREITLEKVFKLTRSRFEKTIGQSSSVFIGST